MKPPRLVVSGHFRAPTPDKSVDYCSGCRVCNMVCPTGVKIAEMNARARAVMVQQGKVPALLRLRNNMVARAELLGKVAQPVAPLANFALNLKPARLLAESIFSHPPPGTFSALLQRAFHLLVSQTPATPTGTRIRWCISMAVPPNITSLVLGVLPCVSSKPMALR